MHAMSIRRSECFKYDGMDITIKCYFYDEYNNVVDLELYKSLLMIERTVLVE